MPELTAKIEAFEAKAKVMRRMTHETGFHAPDSFANAAKELIEDIRSIERSPHQRLLILAKVISEIHFYPTMLPMAAFAQETLSKIKRCDGTCVEACGILAEGLKKSERDKGANRLFVRFWAGCAKKVSDIEKRKQLVQDFRESRDESSPDPQGAGTGSKARKTPQRSDLSARSKGRPAGASSSALQQAVA